MADWYDWSFDSGCSNKKNSNELFSFVSEINHKIAKNGKKCSIEVRISLSPITSAITIIDFNTIFFSPYVHNIPQMKMPTYQVISGTRLYDTYEGLFKKIWDSDNLSKAWTP